MVSKNIIIIHKYKLYKFWKWDIIAYNCMEISFGVFFGGIFENKRYAC
jgi:hypothetical protein